MPGPISDVGGTQKSCSWLLLVKPCREQIHYTIVTNVTNGLIKIYLKILLKYIKFLNILSRLKDFKRCCEGF